MVGECIWVVTHPELQQSLKTGFLVPTGTLALSAKAAPSPVAELLKISIH